ncbi:DUF1636 family protein [Pseudonocardia sp. H11422]|uniref:DUF1636 family protein n=1 Tax=Pseudonocardia sp. H11422 TaxID=2835866 RepID=UPI001BDCFDD9|nr:DUF1636 family protein [Pseudonocardia sp. H11422]
MTLLICRTCPRYESRSSGTFSAGLRRAIAESAAAGAQTRTVFCLGGCPDSGNVALDAPGKARVRISGLTPDDAPSVLEASAAHQASATGLPGEWPVPESLAGRITSVSPKRDARVGPANPRVAHLL